MKNPLLGKHEASDIRRQVDKVLRGLGNPEPPLDLRLVRELLNLDRQYYSSTDDTWLREKVSRVKIAGKQLFQRPMLLMDVVKKAQLSGLWIPDHQRILIDSGIPEKKHRWIEAHEIGHKLTPWHERYLFGDDAETLQRDCHDTLESEANYAGGQLLFLGARFGNEANDLGRSINAVMALHTRYGNSIPSTLWRFVEETHPGIPMVGLITVHPQHLGTNFDPHDPCRYCIESESFRERFGTGEKTLFALLKEYCSWKKTGPLGTDEFQLTDRNGDSHTFIFASFATKYDTFTLGAYKSPVRSLVSVG